MGHSGSKFTVSAIQAIKSGNSNKLRALLAEFKQFIDSQDQDGNTLLKIAVLNEQVNIVRTLLDEGADVNAPDSAGMICLHTAVELGNKDIVQLLVDRGAYLNQRNDDYKTPLAVAVSKDNIQIINVLLDKQANVNITDLPIGNSPLHVAVANGNLEATRLILERGKDVQVNHQNVEGYTPLMLALLNEQEEAAQILCDHGGDGAIVGSDGVAPILVAISKKYVEIARRFIGQRVDMGVTDKSNNTALVLALEHELVDLAKDLLASGADTHSTENKKSPIHMAAALGAKEVVDALLDGGVDVNSLNTDDESPLIVAVKNQREDVVHLLIDRGAQKEDLYKAMRIATMKCNKGIVKLLHANMDDEQIIQFLMQVGMVLEDSVEKAGASSNDEDKTCIVCFEASRDAVSVPCGHAACCSNCLEGFPAPRLCPICRVPVQHIQKIYRV